jgi:linalool 8-monooxygenase
MDTIQADFAPDLKNPDLYVEGVPYELFARLRREDPVYWNPETNGSGFFALTRHADIVEVSRQPALFSSAYENGGHRIFNENELGLTGAGDSAIGIPFISRDPPSHTEYRKFVVPALSPARLAGIEQRISERCAEMVAKIPAGQEVDLVPILSAPLPLLTLAELLGIPGDSWHDLYRWTNAFVGEDDPEFRQSPEAMGAILGEFFGFAQELFEKRRAEPGEDIASMLANAQINGEPIPFKEFVGNLILVLVGGNETTRNSISQSVIAFANNPDQWDEIRADPSLLKSAVVEMVRFASPVMHMRRTATADTQIAGKDIPKGSKIVLWYSSGNRDDAAYVDPDRFNIRRKGPQHVAFGAGQHVVFGQLAARVKRFEVTATPRRFRSNFINGLKDLKVRFHAA